MEILYIILTVIFLFLGLIGIFLPVLPGIPLAFLGYVFLGLATHFHHAPVSVYIILGILTLLAILSDYLSSVLTVKWAGGSKWAITGAVFGVIAGLFTGNISFMILFPLLFAFLFEFIASGNIEKSMRSGISAMLGFFLSVLFRIFIYFLMPLVFILGWILS